jgi:hypothetical protein
MIEFKIEWREVPCTAEPCIGCNEIIYGKQYQLFSVIGDKATPMEQREKENEVIAPLQTVVLLLTGHQPFEIQNSTSSYLINLDIYRNKLTTYFYRFSALS